MRRAVLIASFVALVIGCRGRDDLDDRRRPLPGLAGTPAATNAPAPPPPTQFSSLIDNRATMMSIQRGSVTVRGDGIRIVPYIDGNHRGEWSLAEHVDGESAALIRGRVANIFVPLDGDDGGVLANARSSIELSVRLRPTVKAQVASVFVNEVRQGEVFFKGTQWQTASIAVPSDQWLIGENRVRLYFRHVGVLADADDSPAAFAWMTVGAAAATSLPQLEEQGGKRSLATATPTRLSFYMLVPPAKEQPTLDFAASGKGAAHVAIAADGLETKTLWQKPPGESPSERHRIDLGRYAGRAVRIDLHGNGTRWLEPRILKDADSATVDQGRASEPVDHVLVWMISSFRADHLEHAPAISRFCREGRQFSNAYSTAPATDLAHADIMWGRFRGREGEQLSLAEKLDQQGFATALISGNGFVNDENGFAVGFDHYDNPMRRRHPHRSGVLWQKAKRFVRSHKDERTLVYVAAAEPHLPYTPSDDSIFAEWGSRPRPFEPAMSATIAAKIADGEWKPTAEQRDFFRALYAAEIRDADEAFGRVLRDLEELGIRDRTLVVVAGDHGEELFENGIIGHGASLGDEALRVPLCIGDPTSGSVEIPEPVTLPLIYAAVLERVGVQAGGHNQGEGALVFRSHTGTWGCRIGDYKLVAPERGSIELTDRRQPGARDAAIALRFTRGALSFAIALGNVWTSARWGSIADHNARLAADHGL